MELSRQPSLYEPSLDTSTYKPPSLYPRKRSHGASDWTRDEWQTTMPDVVPLSVSATRGKHATGFTHQVRPTRTDSASETHATPPHHEGLSRQPYLQAPRSLLHSPPMSERTSPNSQTAHILGHERRIRGHAPGEPVDDHSYSRDRRRSSFTASRTDAGITPPNGSNDRIYDDAHRSTYPSDANHQVHQQDMFHYGTPSHSYGQAAYFSPSPYDYQNGKSRKRSNLPKASTEIMKRWVDENMDNPYPSEEQKRNFAAAAGINLTQVRLVQL